MKKILMGIFILGSLNSFAMSGQDTQKETPFSMLAEGVKVQIVKPLVIPSGKDKIERSFRTGNCQIELNNSFKSRSGEIVIEAHSDESNFALITKTKQVLSFPYEKVKQTLSLTLKGTENIASIKCSSKYFAPVMTSEIELFTPKMLESLFPEIEFHIPRQQTLKP